MTRSPTLDAASSSAKVRKLVAELRPRLRQECSPPEAAAVAAELLAYVVLDSNATDAALEVALDVVRRYVRDARDS